MRTPPKHSLDKLLSALAAPTEPPVNIQNEQRRLEKAEIWGGFWALGSGPLRAGAAFQDKQGLSSFGARMTGPEAGLPTLQ